MTEAHGLSLDQYGVLVTLVSAPGAQLRMGELGARRLVKRARDPEDGRGFLATLTRRGQGLSEQQVNELARIWDSAVPGVVGADEWPPAELWSRE
jgi:DNA-binding MarR family transcriptional regulator